MVARAAALLININLDVFLPCAFVCDCRDWRWWQLRILRSLLSNLDECVLQRARRDAPARQHLGLRVREWAWG